MKFFAALSLCLATVAMALPTDPSGIIAHSEIDAPSNDTALTNVTGIVPSTNVTGPTNVTGIFPPTNDTSPVDDADGAAYQEKIWRYMYHCYDSRRRVHCVNFFDSYCTSEGWISTDDINYCSNPNCFCIGYNPTMCASGRSC